MCTTLRKIVLSLYTDDTSTKQFLILRPKLLSIWKGGRVEETNCYPLELSKLTQLALLPSFDSILCHRYSLSFLDLLVLELKIMF